MKQILYNLALIESINFCKLQGLDCSGTHLIKAPRGYKYTLLKSDTLKPVASVIFKRNSTPEYLVYRNY